MSSSTGRGATKDDRVRSIMKANRSSGTKLELRLRKYLREAGLLGYRINLRTLPGKPDVVFTKQKVAVFVHGCFWHGCDLCNRSVSKTNSQFWSVKIARNRERDLRNAQSLELLGYRVITVWEHEIKREVSTVVSEIQRLLEESDRDRSRALV